jgi:hypothetical protein
VGHVGALAALEALEGVARARLLAADHQPAFVAVPFTHDCTSAIERGPLH